MVRLLLRQPTNPNDLIQPSPYSNWTLFMRDLHERGKPNHLKPNHLMKVGDYEIYLLVRDLLESGADAGAMCSLKHAKVPSHTILRGALLPEHMALLNEFFGANTPQAAGIATRDHAGDNRAVSSIKGSNSNAKDPKRKRLGIRSLLARFTNS
jgi:hypothetical protein